MSGMIELSNVRRLDVKPGDMLLITMPDRPEEQLAQIADDLRAFLPRGIKVLLVAGNVSVTVVSAPVPT